MKRFISVAHPSASVLKSPSNLGLYATRNFYVKYHDDNEEKNISLGVWHILPNYIAKRFSNELGLTEVTCIFALNIVWLLLILLIWIYALTAKIG